MYKLLAVFGAALVGLSAGIQAPMNAELGKISNPRLATLWNFVFGAIIILVVNFFTGSLKDLPALRSAPWYLLLAGGLGTVIVFGTILVVPIIGTGAAISILITFQLAVGMVIDHFGWFGAPKIPINWARVLGFVLLVVGARIVVK